VLESLVYLLHCPETTFERYLHVSELIAACDAVLSAVKDLPGYTASCPVVLLLVTAVIQYNKTLHSKQKEIASRKKDVYLET
jgi:hypothetical protein